MLTVGQSIGGPLRRTALLAPHGQDTGSGPGDFQINVTAAEGAVTAEQTGATGGSPCGMPGLPSAPATRHPHA